VSQAAKTLIIFGQPDREVCVVSPGAHMSETSLPGGAKPSRRMPWLRGVVPKFSGSLWTFGSTLFISAFLMFSVEPLFAKLASPKLGGTPAVWAISLCFFQATLLAGYCYAYALIRWCEWKTTVAIHATLLLVTLSVLPIALPSNLGDPPTGDAYVWLFGVLAYGVGLPFFAVSGNAPLLQAWFARTSSQQATDPYFLYGASNAGSLLALIAYPTIIEPNLGLHLQTTVWSYGFGILCIMVFAAASWMLFQGGATAGSYREHMLTATRNVIRAADRAIWIGLSALPSALMVAVTTYIATDVVSVPLLWVVPLALFLTTFIVVFRDRALIPIEPVSRALPIIFVAISLPYLGIKLWLALAAFVGAALICHRELYLRRPSASSLTEYYLCMSVGGSIGGLFSAILAPKLFVSAFEFTGLMIAVLFCQRNIIQSIRRHLSATQMVSLVIFAAIALCANAVAQSFGGERAGKDVIALVTVAMAFVLWRLRHHPAQDAGLVLGIGLFAAMLPDNQLAFHTERSFFGVVRVIDTSDGSVRWMQHGTTLHGSRRLRTADGTIVTEPAPASYYHPAGPLARSIGLARTIGGTGSAKALRIGVVGLGTGSLACYTRPGDTLTYFEIDPVIVHIAKDSQYFDFISHCRPDTNIIVGDARLTLAKYDSSRFNLLVLDAFSSDSVPNHLLTVEAIKLYFDRLEPDGLLAIHVSNRYLDLISPVIATARSIPGLRVATADFPGVRGDPDAAPSRVVFASRDGNVLEGMSNWTDTTLDVKSDVSPWTDDYSDVLSALVRHMTK
jgi:hypothetical protein